MLRATRTTSHGYGDWVSPDGGRDGPPLALLCHEGCGTVRAMCRVVRGVGLALGVLLATASLGDAARLDVPAISLPSTGNVTVARFTIRTAATRSSVPKLTSRGALPADAYAVATVSKAHQTSSGSRQTSSVFSVTVVIVRPSLAPPPGQASPTSPLTLRLPPGFSLASPLKVAQNVLYMNPAPRFGLVPTGLGQLLVGTSPAKLPLEQVVRDAQLLMLDRSVPLADMALLGLPFVAVQFARSRTTSPEVTLVLSQLAQVNAVEVRFPNGVKVAGVTAPAGAEGMLLGNAVRLIGSTGFFNEGIAYSFGLRLNRAPRTGDFVTVRASTHYFENSLPFTERFALS
jgi:hypothetical protein